MKTLLTKLLMIPVLLFSMSVVLQANESVKTARYTQVSLEPTREMKNPLDVVINVQIPKKMNLVGESIQYLLQRSGYLIKAPSEIPSHNEMYVLFSLPIPAQHRAMGTLRLRTALEVLIGDAYQMHISEVTRKIWFTLKENNKSELQGIDIEIFKQRWNDRLARYVKSKGFSKANNTLVKPNIDKINYDDLVSGDKYGPVSANQTLGEIAHQLSIPGISHSNRMLSLFTANKQAFINDNIDLLKSGAMLTIPNQAQTTHMAYGRINLDDGRVINGLAQEEQP